MTATPAAAVVGDDGFTETLLEYGREHVPPSAYVKKLDAEGKHEEAWARARHTFATRWLRAGGRIERLSDAMGHASVRTTYDLYGHLDAGDVAADHALIEENA